MNSNMTAPTQESDLVLEQDLVGIAPRVSLTSREKQVLELIMAGHTNKQIAQKLYRTERTIEYHRNKLMSKFGTHNIVELIKKCIALNIV